MPGGVAAPVLGSVVNCIFPSFPRRRESRIRTNSMVFGPKFIRIPTIAGMTTDLTTPPRRIEESFRSEGIFPHSHLPVHQALHHLRRGDRCPLC